MAVFIWELHLIRLMMLYLLLDQDGLACKRLIVLDVMMKLMIIRHLQLINQQIYLYFRAIEMALLLWEFKLTTMCV